MSNEIITAKQMRDTATNINTTKHKNQFDDVLKYIQASANKGNVSITYGKTLEQPVLDELYRRGFKTQYQSDQRDGSYYSISW